MQENVDQGGMSREDETVMDKVKWGNIGKLGKKNRHNQKGPWSLCIHSLFVLLFTRHYEKCALGQLEAYQILKRKERGWNTLLLYNPLPLLFWYKASGKDYDTVALLFINVSSFLTWILTTFGFLGVTQLAN